MEEDKKPEDKTDYKKLIKKIAPLLWPKRFDLKLRIFLCISTLLLARVANVMVPLLYKMIVDELAGTDDNPITFPLMLIVWYTLLKLLQSLQRDLRNFIWIAVEQDTSRRIKIMVFRHLHALSLKYHLNRKTGEVLKVVERGAGSLQSLLSMALFTVLPTIIDLVLACIVLLVLLDPPFAVIIFATIFLYGYATVALTNWRKKFRRAMIETDNNANDRAVNSLLNFETVKYFGMEETEVRMLEDKIVAFNKEAWKNEASLHALNSVQQMVMSAGSFALMVLAGQQAAKGSLTVGDFVMILTYLAQLAQPLAWLGTAWRVIQQGFIDMEKMFQLLEVSAEITDSPFATDLVVSKGAIDFDKVTFSYDSQRIILHDFTISIKPGHTCALVGTTGAGKSTIGRLLFRFYDLDRPGGGCIRIDGQDIRDVTQSSLRRSIGVVPQDTVLFNDTIKYNLLYGKPGATDAEVVAAAKGASIHDAIQSFTEQYDTMVGERGLRLSGGEKQRVAIARTILKAPRLVLLDEATSALDTTTEHSIQDALENMCKGRTTVTIAHRLSTVIHAELICVMEQGRIIERGSHPELLELDGTYAGSNPGPCGRMHARSAGCAWGSGRRPPRLVVVVRGV